MRILCKRLYPLLLLALGAPTFAQTTVTVGDQTGATYSGSIDTELYSGDVNTNFGTAATFSISKYGGSDDHRNVVVSFIGTTNIAGPVTVTAATVYLYASTVNGATDIDMFAALRTWNEAQATWNSYTTGNSWTTGGARGSGTDRGSTLLSSVAILNADTGYKAFTSVDFVAYAQAQINAGQPINVVFERNGAGGDFATYTDFESSESATATQRPYVEITFTGGGGGGSGLLLRRRRN